MWPTTSVKWASGAVAAAVMLVACSGADPVSVGPSAVYPSFTASSEPTQETSATPDATGSAEPTPSDTAATPRFVLATDSWPYDAYPMNADGTALSGCSPGSSDSVPDGVWYGVVRAWDADSISFDLACMYHPKSPQQTAYLDSLGPDEPQKGYATSNDNPALRTLPLADGAVFWSAGYKNYPGDSTAPYSEVRAKWGESDYYLYVNDGEVTEAVKVYYP